MKLTQAQIKADIKEYIELKGGYAVVTNISGIPIKGKPEIYRKNPEMSGLGDVISCIGGIFIQFEVKKTAKEKLRDSQEDHKYRLERSGGLYYQVTSLDEVIEILEKRRFRA
ncbi:MAG: hypothetical protein KAV87_12915 [Desulfobacteraceae bacterium]|nr:hypothetical protein [Desulfobacteraceae bacterium]